MTRWTQRRSRRWLRRQPDSRAISSRPRVFDRADCHRGVPAGHRAARKAPGSPGEDSQRAVALDPSIGTLRSAQIGMGRELCVSIDHIREQRATVGNHRKFMQIQFPDLTRYAHPLARQPLTLANPNFAEVRPRPGIVPQEVLQSRSLFNFWIPVQCRFCIGCMILHAPRTTGPHQSG
jgi:hypothetical protein